MPAGAIVLSATIWGAWWIPLRALEAQGLSGSWATFAVYAVALVLLLPVIVRHPARLVAERRALALIALFSGVSLAAWNHALLTGEVVHVMLLFFLCPVWATLITRFVLGQPLARLRLVSIPLGLVGAAVVLGVDGDIPIPRSTGDALALVSGMLFAVATVVIRRAEGVGDWHKTSATFAGCAFGALLVVAALPTGSVPPGAAFPGVLPLLLASAFVVLLPATWLEVWGNSRLDPGAVNVIFQVEILVAAATAGVLTDEPFGWREAIGGALIVGAGLIETLDHGRRARPVDARIPAP